MADDADDDHSGDEIPVAESGRFLRLERKFQQWDVHLFGLHGKGGRLEAMEHKMVTITQVQESHQRMLDAQQRWMWKIGAIAGGAVVLSTAAIQLVRWFW